MLSPEKTQSRVNNRWPVAREGLPFICIALGLTVLLLGLRLYYPGLTAGVLTLFIIYFFRDPQRQNMVQGKAVLTPADGKILDVTVLEDSENPLGEPSKKVSVFMSIFNVHVNRIPIDGTILNIHYLPGKFFSANRDKASRENENNRITLETNDGRRIVVVQIAGLIARRIACWVKEGDQVKRGQRFGLIRFGSRLDIYLPQDSRILVQPCHKVKAGLTILGYLS